YSYYFFFFQAEDGIRDRNVTGVQTCALPIFTWAFPWVRVPVLSNTTTSILFSFSKTLALLISIPFVAPTPVETIIATGVAKPRAQGHEITNTAIALVTAKFKSFPVANK